jgi:hypothetical protein
LYICRLCIDSCIDPLYGVNVNIGYFWEVRIQDKEARSAENAVNCTYCYIAYRIGLRPVIPIKSISYFSFVVLILVHRHVAINEVGRDFSVHIDPIIRVEISPESDVGEGQYREVVVAHEAFVK